MSNPFDPLDLTRINRMVEDATRAMPSPAAIAAIDAQLTAGAAMAAHFDDQAKAVTEAVRLHASVADTLAKDLARRSALNAAAGVLIGADLQRQIDAVTAATRGFPFGK